LVENSVAAPHHFFAAPAPAQGKNFDPAPAAEWVINSFILCHFSIPNNV
jgi:hypothetical protein